MSYVVYVNDVVFSVVPDLHCAAVVLSMIDDTDFISSDSEVSILPVTISLYDFLGGIKE